MLCYIFDDVNNKKYGHNHFKMTVSYKGFTVNSEIRKFCVRVLYAKFPAKKTLAK